METKTSSVSYVEVTNRNNGTTGYTLDDGKRVQFAPGQTRKINIEELRLLMGNPGTEYLLKNFLVINDRSALDYLNMETVPEYFYTEKEINYILTSGNEETLQQLEDCLNFAPVGVIDLVKKIAVDKKIPDMRKRKLILDKTGFNVDNAIRINETLEGNSEPEKKTAPARKAKPVDLTIKDFNIVDVPSIKPVPPMKKK